MLVVNLVRQEESWLESSDRASRINQTLKPHTHPLSLSPSLSHFSNLAWLIIVIPLEYPLDAQKNQDDRRRREIDSLGLLRRQLRRQLRRRRIDLPCLFSVTPLPATLRGRHTKLQGLSDKQVPTIRTVARASFATPLDEDPLGDLSGWGSRGEDWEELCRAPNQDRASEGRDARPPRPASDTSRRL